MTCNLILIGHRGAGKTFLKDPLASQLRLEPYSSDELIIAQVGMSLKSFVKKHSWEAFRSLEEDVCRSLTKKQNALIDCGGGVVENESLATHLSTSGTVLWVDVSLKTLLKRLEASSEDFLKRPRIEPHMTLKEEMIKLYHKRLPLYEKYSHGKIVLDTMSFSKTIQKATEIYRRLSDGR